MKIKKAIRAAEIAIETIPPASPGARWSDWVSAARLQEAAVREAVSALRHAGARIHVTQSHSRMEFAGVSASSTRGGRDLLEQWLAAAHRRAEAMENNHG